jgi:beta-glucosidase
MPKDLTQTVAADPRRYPGVDGRAHYEEGVFVGYRAVTSRGPQPAFPFGHGLGYTTFEYEDLEVASGNGTSVAAVSLTVRNTGGRAGSEVVQVYVGELPAPVPTPSRQLAAFRKVFLEPGRSERLVMEIPRRAVSYFDVDAHDWVVSAGDVDVLVGASSSDERLAGRFAL